jgi:hypothetical protein
MTEREPATLETLAGLIDEILDEMARGRESVPTCGGSWRASRRTRQTNGGGVPEGQPASE